MNSYTLTIDGRKVVSTQTFKVINPVNESVIAACPAGTMELLDQAISAARRSLPMWSALSQEERAAKLLQIADLMETHAPELSRLVTQEQGKPQSGPGANLEVGGAVAWTRATAGLTIPEETIQDDANGRIVIRRKPVGVVGSITPWNWPLMIATWHVMPALRVGCTVVIKPSPYTPLSTLKLVDLMNEVLPPGVINVITGDGDVGARMVADPRIDKLVFTGSIKTGKRVMRGAADTLKRVTLNCGATTRVSFFPIPASSRCSRGSSGAASSIAARRVPHSSDSMSMNGNMRRSSVNSPSTRRRYRWVTVWMPRTSLDP